MFGKKHLRQPLEASCKQKRAPLTLSPIYAFLLMETPFLPILSPVFCPHLQNFSNLQLNVEYNQLDPLLREIEGSGDVNDPATGFSPYPGNINQLVFALEPYSKVLVGRSWGTCSVKIPTWGGGEEGLCGMVRNVLCFYLIILMSAADFGKFENCWYAESS